MPAKDYYKILDVKKDATQDEMKKAHRKLARKYHPDLNPGNKAAEDRFKEIQEAYDILSDDAKRAKYDRYGDAEGGPQQGGPFHRGQPFNTEETAGGVHFDLDDFFERFTGNRQKQDRRSQTQAQPRGVDVDFTVSMEEAFTGVTRRLDLSLEDTCDLCTGTGQKRNSRGHFDLNAGACPKCNGSGSIPGTRQINLTIPPGAWDDMKVRLAGQGISDGHGNKGDLGVTLKVRPSPRFERDGQSLTFELSVPYTVAALGGEIPMLMLSGQTRSIVIPSGVQSGQKMRLGGQGMPALRDRPLGDAFAKIKITVPKDLNDQEKKLLVDLARIRHDSIRS